MAVTDPDRVFDSLADRTPMQLLASADHVRERARGDYRAEWEQGANKDGSVQEIDEIFIGVDKVPLLKRMLCLKHVLLTRETRQPGNRTWIAEFCSPKFHTGITTIAGLWLAFWHKRSTGMKCFSNLR